MQPPARCIATTTGAFTLTSVKTGYLLSLPSLPPKMIYVISVLFLLCFRVRLFIDALWSPAGKGLTS